MLLGVFLSTAEAGIYRFGVRLATAALDIFVQSLNNFALAHFGAAARDGEPLGPILLRFLSTTVVLLGCGAGAIIILAEPAIRAFLRAEYLPATVVAVAFAAKAVFAVGGMYITPFLAAKGRTGLVMTLSGVTTGGVLLAVASSAPFGLAAISWAQAGVSAIASLVALVIMLRLDGFDVSAGLFKLLEGLGMVVAFSVCLALIFHWVQAFGASPGLAVVVALSVGGVLGLGVLALAYRRKLFFPSVMSD